MTKDEIESGIYEVEETGDILVVCGDNVEAVPYNHIEDDELVSALVFKDISDGSEVSVLFETKDDVLDLIEILKKCANNFDAYESRKKESTKKNMKEFYKALSEEERNVLKDIIKE